MERGAKGTRCSLPAFMRFAGIVQAACFRSISLHFAFSTSLVRAAVSSELQRIILRGQRLLLKNALHHTRADAKLPADLEDPVTACSQF